MNTPAINRNPGLKQGYVMVANPEMVLLGGQTPSFNETRVMAANLQSRFVRPADLDAFLQGHYNAC